MADSRQAVFDVIRDHGPVDLRTIERRTGLGHTTVGAMVNELRTVGAVVTVEADRDGAPSRTGRPALKLVLNPELARLVGIQFEHTHIRVAIADLGLRILKSDVQAMRTVGSDPAGALDAGAKMIDKLIRETCGSTTRVAGVTMSLPAPIDTGSGRVRHTDALRGWIGLKPAEELARRVRVLPVQAENDATLAALGEAVVGAARGHEPVVYVKLSATVGGGIVIDGSPFGGATGAAGELTHVVVDEGGPLCFCGNRGCLHKFVGAEGILRELRSNPANRLGEVTDRTLDEQLEAVIRWAGEGDLACRRVIRDVADRLSTALINVCNLINPETIVVGGVLSKAGDLLFRPLTDRVIAGTEHLSPPTVKIVPPRLAEQAEVLGACALVLRSTRPAFRLRLESIIDHPDP